MSRLFAVVAACFLACLVCSGCGDGGPRMGEVTGLVTMDGKPLANAIVSFTPEGGGSGAAGTTDASGNYTLVSLGKQGATIGKHKVSVTTVQTVQGGAEEMRSDSDAYAKQAMGDASAYNTAKVTEPIPAKYNTESTLVKEVTKGSNTINLELTSS